MQARHVQQIEATGDAVAVRAPRLDFHPPARKALNLAGQPNSAAAAPASMRCDQPTRRLRMLIEPKS